MNIGFPKIENQYVVKYEKEREEGTYEIIKIIQPNELLDLTKENTVNIIKAKMISGEDIVRWKSISW